MLDSYAVGAHRLVEAQVDGERQLRAPLQAVQVRRHPQQVLRAAAQRPYPARGMAWPVMCRYDRQGTFPLQQSAQPSVNASSPSVLPTGNSHTGNSMRQVAAESCRGKTE